jgi:hypothetical protein
MSDIYFLEVIQALHEDWTFEQCQDWYYEHNDVIKEAVALYIENLLIRKLS